MNIAIIPIRDDSTRLEKKATGFYLYKNYTPLECITERLLLSELLDKIIFIMPDTSENDNIVKSINKKRRRNKEKKYHKVYSYKGSINDISGRALKAIDYYKTQENNLIINITGDCPLVDPHMIDDLINKYTKNKSLDYNNGYDNYYLISNVLTRSWPNGFDIQIYDEDLLDLSWRIALDKKINTQLGWDIVNYSGYINEEFNLLNFPAPEPYFYPEWGLTLDYKEDIEVINAIYNHFDSFNFTAEQVINYLKDNMHILEINKHCRRNIPGC